MNKDKKSTIVSYESPIVKKTIVEMEQILAGSTTKVTLSADTKEEKWEDETTDTYDFHF